MYVRKASTFPRKAQLKSFPAPIAGWIANRSLANPGGAQQGAAVLNNFFPTSTSIILRRGKEKYATLGDATQDTQALFSYAAGANRRLFAANTDTIYDITTVAFPENVMIVDENGDFIVTETGDTIGWNSTDDLDVWTGATSGDWSVVQMATTGGIYLLGVNGSSTGFIFDGMNFYPNVPDGVWTLEYDGGTVDFTAGETLTGGTSGATATIFKVDGDTASGTLYIYNISGTFQNDEVLTDGDGGAAVAQGTVPITPVVPGVEFPDGLTSEDMDFVFVYQRRVIFVQKDSLTWHYLDPDAVGGTATAFPMGGEFTQGGSIVFGQSWSIGTGASGGLSDQCVFVSTEGQVIVYQGNDPSSAEAWSKVGEYRIGVSLGKKAFIRNGGDLVIGTAIGAVPLSEAISRGYETLSPIAMSYPIEDAWNSALEERGYSDWRMELWTEHQMMLVAPPTVLGSTEPVVYVMNVRTGAWAKYTNWHAICTCVFGGRLFFGGPLGEVYIANVTGLDGKTPYTGAYLPLFEDLGAPASKKIPQVARGVVRATANVTEKLKFHTDFAMELPPAPTSTPAPGGSRWGVGIWGVSVWNEPKRTIIDQQWRAVSGLGYMCSLSYQVTSGSIVPLDAELVRLDVTYTVADIVS